jgi:hypothetical protein
MKQGYLFIGGGKDGEWIEVEDNQYSYVTLPSQ